MASDKRTTAGAEVGDHFDLEPTDKHHADSASDSRPLVIDEHRDREKLIVYGRKGTRRLINSNILISGMQGLGVEIARSLIRDGVKSVTLHDEGNVDTWDRCGCDILSPKIVLGHNRASHCAKLLQGLNKSVRVSVLTTELTKDHLSDFQAVVFTDINLEKAIEFNDYCHQHQPPIAFIKSEVRGLFGSVFCDFGPEFTVLDVGKETCTAIIASITNDNPAVVTCVDDKRLEFQNGDLVVFSQVRGMAVFNDGKPRKIINAKGYTFTIEEDTTNYVVYEGGGIVTQSKVLNFKPLRQALKDPDFVECESMKNPAPVLHLAFQALNEYLMENGNCFPRAGCEDDAIKFIALLTKINNGLVENIAKNLLKNFAFGARAVLAPMATMFGGIVGLEVVKACSGKFHPIFQFFYFDSAESLPSKSLDPDDLQPRLNCRYNSQISVFGSKMQTKLEEAKVFLVGCGFTGRGFVGCLAPMGVCCGETGMLTVTDGGVMTMKLDGLYVDKSKSNVAAKGAHTINNHIRVSYFQRNVNGADTEHVFNDKFWEDLSVVISAVGNNETSKQYLNRKCAYFHKPLLTSATLGPTCSTQMIIPRETAHYQKEEPQLTGSEIPRVANLRSVATGLVCLELYKVLSGNDISFDYRNALVNVARPSFAMHEPNTIITLTHSDLTWTVWDRCKLQGNPTARELFQSLEKHNLYGRSIICDYGLVYSDTNSAHEEERLDRKLLDLVSDMPGFELSPNRSHFDVLVTCETSEGSAFFVPPFTIYFK